MEGNNSNAKVHSGIVNDQALVLAYLAMSVLTLTENIVGLVVINLNPVLHTTANTFLCSAAVVDISCGLFNTISNIFSEFRIRNTFPGTDFIPCIVVTMLTGYTLVSISTVHMTIISCERYIFIAHPFVYRRRVNNKTIAIVLAMFWIFCVTYIAVMFGANSLTVIQDFYNNTSTSKYDHAMFYVGLCIYLVCSTLTAIAYGLIVKVAITRNRLKRERNHITQTDESSKNALKTITFFMVSYGLFAILTMPVGILNVFGIVIGKNNNIVFNVLVVIVLMTPGINFFVLFVLNADFRSALKKTLAGLCRRHR